MSSVTSLNVHCKWTDVLSVVGERPEVSALPARVKCPLCGGPRLTIYEDTTNGGAWHYCFDCRAAGDMIELAAAVWEVPPAAAVRRLADAGIPFPHAKIAADRVAVYADRFPGGRTRMDAFWARAKAYLPRAASAELSVVRERLRFHTTMSPDRWNAGPANLVGASTAVATTAVFWPSQQDPGRLIGGAVRLFRGTPCRECVVVPHYDLPGRICGLYIVGRRGRPGDRVFKPFQPVSTARVQEAGLACFWAVHKAGGAFGSHVFACPDTALAVRLHIRHFNAAGSPLPLVAFYDGAGARTISAWKALDGKVPVVWGWELTPALLYQAVVADGLLAFKFGGVRGDDQAAIDHYIRDNDAKDILKRALRRAKPWRDALVAWAETATDREVEIMLSGMEAYGTGFREAMAVCPRLKEMARLPEKPVSAVLHKAAVVEKDSCWWHSVLRNKHGDSPPHTDLVMNAVLRIDRTTVRKADPADKGEVCYAGRLIYRGEEYPFELPVRAVKKDTVTELTDVLARNVPGAVLVVAPNWRLKLIDIALAFSPHS